MPILNCLFCLNINITRFQLGQRNRQSILVPPNHDKHLMLAFILKAFEQKNGDIAVFRIEENAKRMVRSCKKVLMEPPTEELFIDAVNRVVNANRRFVPPYGTGASLYIRPLLLGSGAQVGVKPAGEYLFIVFVTPVGPYFKTGFKPVQLVVETEFDRAAPLGVGDVKVGGRNRGVHYHG